MVRAFTAAARSAPRLFLASQQNVTLRGAPTFAGLALVPATATSCKHSIRLLSTSNPAVATNVKVGDQIPSVSLDKGFPPTPVPMHEFCKGKKIVLVGLPGAFTPT